MFCISYGSSLWYLLFKWVFVIFRYNFLLSYFSIRTGACYLKRKLIYFFYFLFEYKATGEFSLASFKLLKALWLRNCSGVCPPEPESDLIWLSTQSKSSRSDRARLSLELNMFWLPWPISCVEGRMQFISFMRSTWRFGLSTYVDWLWKFGCSILYRPGLSLFSSTGESFDWLRFVLLKELVFRIRSRVLLVFSLLSIRNVSSAWFDLSFAFKTNSVPSMIDWYSFDYFSSSLSTEERPSSIK